MDDLDNYMALRYAIATAVAQQEKAADCERSAFFSEHWPSLLDSLKMYLKETKISCLNLKRTGIQGKELISILEVLKDLQVTELNIHDNRFEFEMETVSKHFAKTGLRKLNISKCDLVDEDVLLLMRVLKDTQITHLDLSDNDEVDFTDIKSSRQFVSSLLKSHLTVLNLRCCKFSSKFGALFLVRALPSSCITHLNLSQCCLSSESLVNLFSNLAATSITDLDVSDNEITSDVLQPISRSLKNSKLKKLDLGCNKLDDKGVNFLAENLPLCELISLNLSDNCISGANNLCHYLQNSKIEEMNLDCNHIAQITMFSCPDFVKGSSVHALHLSHCKLGDELGKELMKSLEDSAVIKLVVSGNNLGLMSISEFAKIVKGTVIEDVNFSSNSLSAEAILMLGDSLKGSKIKRIDISYNFNEPGGSSALSAFVAKTKDTSVESLMLRGNHIDAGGAEMIAACLINTTVTCIDLGNNEIGVGAEMIAARLKGTPVTYLNLESNKIGIGAVNFAAHLSSTIITHLNLSSNRVGDEGAIALAECLKGTQIMDLNLDYNSITSLGAKAFAGSLKKSNLLSLKLTMNKIDDDGFEALAAQTKNMFLQYFEADGNEGSGAVANLLFTDKYFWENRVLAHKFVRFFKKISPEIGSEDLTFDRSLATESETGFLEECLHFYKSVTELPAAICVLAEEDSLSFSKKQIAFLLLEKFPKQFIAFVDRKIKPNVVEFIKCLKKVEELELVEILKPLLLNPPKLNIGDGLCITHPFFYNLIHKYDQPLGCETIELPNKIQVIKFLSENPAIEGALDMISVLRNEMMS